MIGLPDAGGLVMSQETWEFACLAAEERRVDDEDLLTAQRILAEAGRWDGVYILSVMAGLETSVLIDADDKVFIDWGTAGQVTLQPPVGGRLPFKPILDLPPIGAAPTRTASAWVQGFLNPPWCWANPALSTAAIARWLKLTTNPR